MDSEAKKQKAEADLEVTGVSRSGRVRKKSSKLMDFESPDDIEARGARRPPPPARPRPPPRSEDVDMEVKTEEDDGSASDSDFFDASLDHPDSMDSMDSEEGGSDGEGGAVGEQPESAPSRPAHSLYMMEKSTKKKLVVRDGKVVGRAKAQRKDKGKTRVTAYMMWAKGVRNDLIRKYPDMDFSAISKRLGEMWANVNYLERYVWKRKAKRWAAKKGEPGSPAKAATLNNTSKNTSVSNHGGHSITSTPARSRQTSHSKQTTPHNTNSVTGSASGGSGGGGSSGGGLYRVVGVGPAEVGAHLRLLGESLAIIGERLKEHEGQIAVSGSVSVLLDTLLCSLAPLVCLTAHLPAIAPPLPLLQDTLDNIAYIMPGL